VRLNNTRGYGVSDPTILAYGTPPHQPVVGRSPAGDFDGRTKDEAAAAVAQLFLRGLDGFPSWTIFSPSWIFCYTLAFLPRLYKFFSLLNKKITFSIVHTFLIVHTF
jgi:hypothetical protein